MDNDEYQRWFKKCDELLTERLGVGVDDIADAPWRAYFGDGLRPDEALGCALLDCNDMELDQILELGFTV